jgi:uncharacterized membrane protein
VISVQDWWHEYLADVLWVGAGVLVLATYHLYLGKCSSRNPHCTIQSVNRGARRAWVEHIMNDPGNAVLAVQTLRNSTMAATFFASTAVLLLMGVLSLSGQADRLADSWHVLNAFGSHHPGLWVIKLLALTATLLSAFFSFAMSVRLFNHVGYQVNLPPALRPSAVTPEQVARHLNRAGSYYSVGMRAYFLAVPLVFWLFGPHLMALSSVVLVVVLYHMDRIPAPSEPSEP